MEIAHKLIHVRKELGERNWLDEPDDAECCELAPRDGCGRVFCLCLCLDVLVVEEGTCLVEGLVSADGRHGEEGGGDGGGKEKRMGLSALRFYRRRWDKSCWVETSYVLGGSRRATTMIGALPYMDNP